MRLRKLALGCVLLLSVLSPLGALAGDRGALNVQALVERLKLGNARFVANEPNPSDLSSLQRTLLTARQRPWCVVLGCSDARVPPEHIFSAGLGDLVTLVLQRQPHRRPDAVVVFDEQDARHAPNMP